MAEYEDRERFIPLRTSEIINLICNDGFLSEKNKEKFREFATILGNIFHYEFKSRTEELEDFYYPFNPDTDKTTLTEYSRDKLKNMEANFYNKIRELLNDGNFNLVGKEEIEYAFNIDSEIAVKVDSDLEDFKKLLLFKRGESSRTIKVSRFFSIFKKKLKLDIFERLVMIIKFSPDYEAEKTTLKEEVYQDKIYIKTFKNVPKSDLEMVFPNSKVRMEVNDKLKIVLPVLVGLGAGMAKFFNIIRGKSSLILTASLIIALIGYVIKSYVSYKNTILEYIKTLTTGLYFRNLSNNAGVIQYLINEAEAEETKEALLGYYFLFKNKGAMSSTALDDAVEDWFEGYGIKIDWEVKDALKKLKRLELIKPSNNHWNAISLDRALDHLDYIWDNYFQYNQLS